jgi:N-formylglutamate amidohydrolase
MSNHYLIHLPHCGTKIPEQYINDYLLDKQDLENNIFQYADIYTDELFGSLFDKFGGVKNEYSRLFFDPERFGDDDFEKMYQKFRLGWFYENAILEKKPLRGTQNKSAIRKYFNNHHLLLNKLTQEKLDKYDRCTVIDCHSFSNERYWFHEDIKLPDICVGFEDNHIDETLINIIKDEFKDFDIGINKPYQGSLVPTDYWGKDKRVKSVMIEINKKLYVDDDNITKNSNFNIIKQKIDNILTKLARLD